MIDMCGHDIQFVHCPERNLRNLVKYENSSETYMKSVKVLELLGLSSLEGKSDIYVSQYPLVCSLEV